MSDSPRAGQPGKGTQFSIEIQPLLPKQFARLPELSNDLYYSWNYGVRGLFRHLDADSLHGNVTEGGDVGGGPGKSSLFFLTASHPEIGLSGARV